VIPDAGLAALLVNEREDKELDIIFVAKQKQNKNGAPQVTKFLIRIICSISTELLSLFFRIYTLTWNTNGQIPPVDLDCRKLLGLPQEAYSAKPEHPDIYVLG
jgi:hypothetical protein